MEDLNLTLVPIEELPETDLPKKKKKPKVNCLGTILRETLEEFGLKDAEVVKQTGIAWSSYHGWVVEDVNAQMADYNLLRLWQFLNKYKRMHMEYLLFGIGEPEDLKSEDVA